MVAFGMNATVNANGRIGDGREAMVSVFFDHGIHPGAVNPVITSNT